VAIRVVEPRWRFLSRLLLAVLLTCGLAAACGDSSTESPTATASAPPTGGGGTGTGSPSTGGTVGSIRLKQIASLDSPVAMAIRNGDAAIYVAEQTGRIVSIRDGTVDPTPVLDLSSQISTGGERGLLGLAFSPDGRFLYVNYTDLDGNTNVVEFAMDADGRADVRSRREILFVKQPFPNHNGGNLVVGPDGDLYIGLGDGGSGGDPLGNGQNLGVLLGKMLRIEPRMPNGSLPPNGAPYAIPAGNPFVGTPGARPEIWAYGLRNPWRYEFDRTTGDLWIGDVGQNAYEEVDLQPHGSHGGQNYGWNLTEGSHLYGDATAPPRNWTRPLFDFSHDDGSCAVIGGFVYRGSAIPWLRGAYLYTDLCRGELLAVRQAGGRVTQRLDLGIHMESPSSFGQDAAGELYVLSLSGPVYRFVP
jgi:glucose/arabinose dehydrogenase